MSYYISDPNIATPISNVVTASHQSHKTKGCFDLLFCFLRA